MTPEQCRAARAWLTLSQDDLARDADVETWIISNFEVGHSTPVQDNLSAIQGVLETRGIIFVDDENVSGIFFSRKKQTNSNA